MLLNRKSQMIIFTVVNILNEIEELTCFGPDFSDGHQATNLKLIQNVFVEKSIMTDSCFVTEMSSSIACSISYILKCLFFFSFDTRFLHGATMTTVNKGMVRQR